MRRFVIKETCVVGRVRVPLLAACKLLKQGWQLVRKEQPETPSTGEEAGGLILQSPGGLRAPVAFKHNSLIVQGEVRAITEVPRSLPPKVPKVTLTAEMAALVGNEGMHSLAGGVKMHYAARPRPTSWTPGRGSTPPSTRQGPPCFAQWLAGGFRWIGAVAMTRM